MQHYLLLFSVIAVCESCMRTVPGDPVIRETTTTTMRPITITPTPACAMCPTDLVIFHPANGPFTTDALSESLPRNEQGCRRMYALCESGSSEDNALMEFNNGIAGPRVAPTVRALLVCRADQKWYYSDGVTSLAITDVSCSTTKPPPPTCGTCNPNDVTFHPASGDQTADAIREPLPNNVQGCRRMNAVCESGSATDNAFMEFNGGIAGPRVAPTVKALLVCRADQKWYYSDGTTALAITDVYCSTTKGSPADTCATCDASSVTFHPATGEFGTDAMSEVLSNNAQGCKQMNAICESGSATATSTMEFNNGVGGPPEAATIKAVLICKADQKWYYSDGTSSLAITDVKCQSNAGQPGQACAACDENAVLFHKKTTTDEVDVIKQTLSNNADGCKQMNAVCTASKAGLKAFMEFNGGIGGPDIAETITALLTCHADGKWYFTLGQNSLEITEVRCNEAMG